MACTFKQYDSRWGNKNYNGSSTMAMAGCGPTACAMVLHSIKKNITPWTTAKYMKAHGYAIWNNGTAQAGIPACLKAFGMKNVKERKTLADTFKAMEDNDKKERAYYYTPRYSYDRDIDRRSGKMYYGGDKDNTYYMDKYLEGYPPMHDYREGKSHLNRRNYMESKEMHKDKHVLMNELEKYMQELSMDITEMIEDASPEEKQMLKQKLEMLNDKIQ